LVEQSVFDHDGVTGEDRARWKQLGDTALERGEFNMAKHCFKRARDPTGLLLLATSTGDRELLRQCLEIARATGKHNVIVTASMLLGDSHATTEGLLAAGRPAEACFFARTYCPSHLSAALPAWKEDLTKVNPNLASALGDVDVLEGFEQTLQMEKALRSSVRGRPSRGYHEVKDILDIDCSSTDFMSVIKGAKHPSPVVRSPPVPVSTPSPPMRVASTAFDPPPRAAQPESAVFEDPPETSLENQTGELVAGGVQPEDDLLL
jgi:hypothetical protein